MLFNSLVSMPLQYLMNKQNRHKHLHFVSISSIFKKRNSNQHIKKTEKIVSSSNNSILWKFCLFLSHIHKVTKEKHFYSKLLLKATTSNEKIKILSLKLFYKDVLKLHKSCSLGNPILCFGYANNCMKKQHKSIDLIQFPSNKIILQDSHTLKALISISNR